MMCPSEGIFFIRRNNVNVKDSARYGEQIKNFIDRGCIIDGVENILDILKRVNYYRLTAYFLPYECKEDDKYKPNTNFYYVYKTYEFDQKLNVLLYSVIQEIEIFIKTQIAYYHANKYGALGYLDGKNFKLTLLEKHEKLINTFNVEIKRNQDKLFVKHHINKYDGKFPLWVAVELFSMGNISKLYAQMITADQKNVASDIEKITGQPTTHTQLHSWLKCLTDIRNKCAHFSRLYYFNFSSIPKQPKGLENAMLINTSKYIKLYQFLFVLKFLYPQPKNWMNFLEQLQTLIDQYNSYINLSHIGFPCDWKELLN